MNIDQAIRYFDGKLKLAQALKVSPSAVSHWVKARKIPELQRYKIKELMEQGKGGK